MNYENEIKALADAQKKVKQQELEAAKQSTLTSIQQEQDTLMPTYQKQRQQTNAKSQLGAKNFAEYLANRGLATAGISAQSEMSRQNTLGNNISDINTEESKSLQNFTNMRNQAETGYQNNLASAYGNIDLNTSQNLITERQRQEEARVAAEQRAFENSLAIAKYNESQNKPQNYANTTIPYQAGIISQAIQSGGKTVFTLADGSKLTLDKGVNPFTGNINKDLYDKDEVTGKLTYNNSKAFSGGYQPNNIGGKKVSKTGNTTTYNGQTQNIWKTAKDTYWVWDGKQNKYVRI